MSRTLTLTFVSLICLSSQSMASVVLSSAPQAQPAVAIPAVTKPSLQSFKEWKTQKIQEVQVRVDWLKYKVELLKTEVKQNKIPAKSEAQLTRELGIPKFENDLKSATYSLEMAKDLTVSDYFAAYLTKQEHKKEAFKEVAGKMTADEVADLMTAYANSMFSTQGVSVPAQGDDVSEKIK